MAVARDAITKSPSFTADTDFNHTPAGTPRGVEVYIAQNGSAADQVDFVLYGGVPMTRKAFAADTVTEPMAAYAYFLGTGVPTGLKSVTIGETGGATKVAWVVTLTADADTEVEASGVAQENQANPAVTLATGAGVETYVSSLLMSGLGNQGSITAGAEGTKRDNFDFGQQVAVLGDRNTNGTGGNVVFDWVAVDDDVAMVALAVREVAGAAGQTLELGNVPGPSAVRGVDLTQSGAVALSLGKVTSGADVRGVALAQSGPVVLALGAIGATAAVRGVALVSGSTQTLALGRVATAADVRGLTLAQSGPVTLTLGKATRSPAVHGLALARSGPLTLVLGKASAAGAPHGLMLVKGSALTLALGRVSRVPNVRGIELAQSGAVALDLGHVASAVVVRGMRIRLGALVVPNRVAASDTPLAVVVLDDSATGGVALDDAATAGVALVDAVSNR